MSAPVGPGMRPLSPERARLVPAVALALAAWKDLGLELGEAAIVTGAGPFAALLGVVAGFRGGTPVIGWTDPDEPPSVPGGPAGSRGTPLEAIRAAIAGRPGFAAIDIGGHPQQIDVLLEAAPRFGRIRLGAPRMPPLTIDYYNNIHRKGVLLRVGALDPGSPGIATASPFPPGADPVSPGAPATAAAESLPAEPAVRILANDELAAACLRAFPPETRESGSAGR